MMMTWSYFSSRVSPLCPCRQQRGRCSAYQTCLEIKMMMVALVVKHELRAVVAATISALSGFVGNIQQSIVEHLFIILQIVCFSESTLFKWWLQNIITGWEEYSAIEWGPLWWFPSRCVGWRWANCASKTRMSFVDRDSGTVNNWEKSTKGNGNHLDDDDEDQDDKPGQGRSSYCVHHLLIIRLT